MDLEKAPEVILWRAVIVQAVRDAQTNGTINQCGTERIYRWSKTLDCKEVCANAQMSHKDVRIGFCNIYIDFLWEELHTKKRELHKKGYQVKQIDKILKPLRKAISDVEKRKELLKCKKL